MNYPPLQTSGSGAIDINGLNPKDRARIRKVGLDRWLDEIAKKTPRNLGVICPPQPQKQGRFSSKPSKKQRATRVGRRRKTAP